MAFSQTALTRLPTRAGRERKQHAPFQRRAESFKYMVLDKVVFLADAQLKYTIASN